MPEDKLLNADANVHLQSNNTPHLFSKTWNEDSLISEEVKEIISYRPHWMIRKGNAVFFIVIFSLLLLTWFISYPDVITGSARLVAVNAPKMLPAKTEGKLEKLLVTNETLVVAGQSLAWLQSTASHQQVIQLKNWLDENISVIKNSEVGEILSKPLPPLQNLGELQTAYQEFEATAIETSQVLQNGYYQKKKVALQKDLAYLSQLKGYEAGQKQLLQQDKLLQQKEFEAYEKLAKEKVIAPLELNQYKSKLLSKEQSLEQADAQITNSEIGSNNKRKELLDLQKFVTDQEQKFYSSLLNLKSKVEEWMNVYVVTAPESGKVFFINSIQPNEFIKTGQELFYIQAGQTKFYGELMVPQSGLGKLKAGQKVIIKPESYPVNEYGYLTGMVKYISNLPNRRDSFLVKLDLPNGLITNQNKTIFFRNNLSAKGEVITDDRKLFDRLIGQLKNIFGR